MAWNGSIRVRGYSKARRREKKSYKRILGIGVAIALLMTVLSFLLTSASDSPAVIDDDSSLTAMNQSMRIDTQFQSGPKHVRRETDSIVPEVADTEKVKSEEKKPGVFAPGMLRLPNGLELRYKLPAEGETRQLMAGGEIWEVDSKGEIKNITPPPIFEKPFEGMISSLFERDGTVLPFALKQFSEEDVRRMCREPTLSYEDDTPEITAKRENVAMLKKAILDFMDEGGTFEEFVDDMQQHSQNAQRAQIKGFHDIRDLLVAGKGQEAVEYYKTYSLEMADKGYGELKLPPSFRNILEEEMNK